MTAATKRLQRELASLITSPVPNCSAEPKEDDIFKWVATIAGPMHSPYERGVFVLDIEFPKEYPFKAPIIVFQTPIYHCNINQDGHICLDILKDNWSPALSISRVLLSISSLLTDPNPNDPLVGDAAHLLINNRPQYEKTAREWTERFACK